MADHSPRIGRETDVRDPNVPESPTTPAADQAPGQPPAAWRGFARATGDELRESLGVSRYLRMGDADRARLAKRLQTAVDRALEVPPDLPARIAQRAAAALADAGDEADPVAIAWKRTRERARRTAAIGTATTIPAMLPVLGPALAALGIIADWRLVAEQQRDLVLEIAALFGRLPSDPTAEVRGLFMASAGSALVGTQVGEAVAKAAAQQVARRTVARLMPGVGAAVAGTFNYAATIALGQAAIRRFAAQAGVEVRGVLPERVHPAMPRLRERVREDVAIGLLRPSGAEGPARTPLADEIETIAALTDAEREELLDTAIATALSGGIDAREESRLRAVGAVLGFVPEEVDAAREAFEASLLSYRERVGRLFARTRGTTAGAVQRVWRAAGRIAGKG